ncbi:hypothetical protein [Coleofasciculus sp. F4-SAH-05]|uniref:hypothetical protein n=1 Tax=Coleofasciculus sp. F4-SAH-05 TaxID=3069525 RepID=UPI0032F62100
MAEPTLGQVAGTNSTQNLTTWTIDKSDLNSVGLTATETNTGESLFVSFFLKAKEYLTPENQVNNPDIQVTIVDGGQSLITRNGTTYRQTAYFVYYSHISFAYSASLHQPLRNGAMLEYCAKLSRLALQVAPFPRRKWSMSDASG